MLSFLLRIASPYGHWTKMRRRWLGELTFAHPAQHLAHEEILQRIERAEALCDRLKRAIAELLPQWSLARSFWRSKRCAAYRWSWPW